MGKLLTKAKVNREVMYQVLHSLWYSNEWVNFVEVGFGCFLIKFGTKEDRDRIFSMAPWLFDQHILSMVAYVKDKNLLEYEFNMVLFWVRVFNILMALMDRRVDMVVGEAIGKVLAIDWQDRRGCWVDFKRIRVLLDTAKPLRRVACFMDRKGQAVTGVIKYERLSIFCYLCGRVGHSTQKCHVDTQ